MSQQEKAGRFLELHHRGTPLLMPNVWDAGSAKLFASLGFEAVATTSSGFAATLGRLDGGVSRDEAIAHGGVLAEACDVPVSADLEDCFAEEPAGVAETIRLAIAAGLAGGSVEDFTRDGDEPIYDAGLARDRVAAAAEAAHTGPVHFVLTARAENHVHGRNDLADTITRLQSYQEAGADVLFAPGVVDLADIRQIVDSVDRPVNVLGRPGMNVADLREAGVSRVSVGGAIAYAAIGAAVDAAREIRDHGTFGYGDLLRTGMTAVRSAFRSS